MTQLPNAAEALGVVLDVIGAETGCSREELLAPGVRVVERPSFEPRPENARRYPVGDPGIQAFSFGRGTVVAASASLVDEVRRIVPLDDRDAPFAPAITHPLDLLLRPHGIRAPAAFPRLLGSSETIRRIDPPAGIRILVEDHPGDDRLESLGPERWPNAYRVGPEARPRRCLAMALSGDELVAVAGASAETERLSQTGVDVAPEHRGRGFGPLVAAAAARHELERGRVPYYGFDPPNIPSHRTGLAAGFLPSWIELINVLASRLEGGPSMTRQGATESGASNP